MAKLNEEKLEQDPFDPLVEKLITDFQRQFNLFKTKNPDSLITQWLAKQGVSDATQYNMTEGEIVIASKSQNVKSVNGPAIVQFKDNSLYIGNLANTKRTGFGYRTYPKSDLVYAGEYLEDKKNGIGRIYSMNRKVWGFKGEHKNDMKNGHGRWEKADGNTYTGNFVNDKLQGYGIMTWPNGDRYEGAFERDFKNGYGKMVWSNGDQYEGDFKDNNMNGQGKYTWKNGEFYEGDFKNGVTSGHGTMDYTSAIAIKGTGADVHSIRNLNFDLIDYKGPNRSQVH